MKLETTERFFHCSSGVGVFVDVDVDMVSRRDRGHGDSNRGNAVVDKTRGMVVLHGR